MTQVNLQYRMVDGVNPDGVLITDGSVSIAPATRYDTSSGEMTTSAYTVNIGSTVLLAPGVYSFKLVSVPDGAGGYLDSSVYRLVPSSGGPYGVTDLAEVTPSGGTLPGTDWQSWVVDYVSTHGTGGNTPTIAARDINDSTTIGRALVTAANAGVILGQAGIPNVDNTHDEYKPVSIAQAAAINAVATNVTSNTASIVDLTAHQTWDWISGKPSTFPPSWHWHYPADIPGLADSPIHAAALPPASGMFVQDPASTRPTTRTDIICLWKSPAGTIPANAFKGDILLTGAGSSVPDFTDTFTAGDGSTWSSGNWATGSVYATTGATATIQGNRGSMYSGTVGSYAGRMNVARTGSTITDGEWSGTFQFPSGTDGGLELWHRATNIHPTGGYLMRLHHPGLLILSKMVGSVGTDLASVSYGFTNATDYKVRFRVTGSNLQGKVWLAAAAEPLTWSLSAVDTDVTAAGISLISATGGFGEITVLVDSWSFDPLTTVTNDLKLSIVP